MAAVAVFALGAGGVSAGLLAFGLMALTMGLVVFLIALIGSSTASVLARPLRRWGHWVQVAAAGVIILVGAALIANGISPGVWQRLVLGS